MRKSIALFVPSLFACVTFTPAGMAQVFSYTPRIEVVHMAYYALSQDANGGCDQTVPDNSNTSIKDCVSSWNFLDDAKQPSAAFQTVLGWYNVVNGYTTTSRSCLASDWMLPSEFKLWYASQDLVPCVQLFTPSLYSDVADYGYSTAGGSYGDVGRGGQCRFFANLVYYRAIASLGVAPKSVFSDMWSNVQKDLSQTKPGDILITDPAQVNTLDHTAIVVSVGTDGSGNTTLTVIDSNWIPDITGVKNREVIAMHTINAGDWPKGIFGIWTGSSYYSDPWISPPTGLTFRLN